MRTPVHDPAEAGAKAREIYERQLKPVLEPEFKGKFILIDIDSGDYELGEREDHSLPKRLRERRPEGRFHLLRVGFPAVGRIGIRPKL